MQKIPEQANKKIKIIMSIFRRRLLASQQLLWQDPLSHPGHPKPMSGWAAQAPMARGWLLLPWGCRAAGSPAPDHRDLHLCSGRGSRYTCSGTAPPTKHGLEGGKWKRDPTRAPPLGRNLVFGRMRIHRKVLPTYTFTNTLVPPTAAYPCPCHEKCAQHSPTCFTGNNHLRERPEHKQQQTFLRPPLPFHPPSLPNLIAWGRL